MTWVWGILAWVVASVLLGMLVGILLGLRRDMEDLHIATGRILRDLEDIHQDLMGISDQVRAARSEVGALLTVMEKKGILK